MNSAPPSRPQHDQAARLRAIVSDQKAHTPRPAPIIAIASGKGGVGKTNIAVNLAAALARTPQRRVTLIDADVGLANADVLCGLSPLRRLDSIASAADASSIAIPAPGSFRLVPGAVGLPGAAAGRPAVVDVVSAAAARADAVIVDLAAGLGEDVLACLRLADRALVVATPEPTSIADAYALIKSLMARGMARPPMIVVNQAIDHAEGLRVHERISAVCARFLRCSVGLVGVIPTDPGVPRAVRARSPWVVADPECPASRAMHTCAADLASALAIPPSPPAAAESILRRARDLWTWFRP